MTVRATERWRGATALTLAAAGVGVFVNQPSALLLGVVGVAFAAYARVVTPPDPVLTAERSLSETDPDPGDEVTVTLEVTNGGGFLPDLRLVDDVPAALEVADGSPRLATALRAGKTATLSYTVVAARGEHVFSDATVLTRDPSGARERETATTAERTLRCVPRLDELASFPVRDQTDRRTGQVLTEQGGPGIEFHSVREYRAGDPRSRVDWRRLARTGEFATVQFREERAATVALVVDTRESAYVGGEDGDTAVDDAVTVAGGIAHALLAVGSRVGVASLGPEWAWLEPGLGRDHRERLRRLLALDAAFGPKPSSESFGQGLALRQLRKRLPADAQVVFCSPLVDDYAVTCAHRLDAYGHRVTVVSPNVTGYETPGRTLAAVERALRVRGIRQRGLRVVDWDTEQPFPVAVANAARGWSR